MLRQKELIFLHLHINFMIRYIPLFLLRYICYFLVIHKNFSCTFTQLNATFIWAAVSRNWQPQRNVWHAGKEHKKGPKCCKGCRMPLPSETLTGILDVLVLLMSSFKEIIKTHNLMTIQGLKVQKPTKRPASHGRFQPKYVIWLATTSTSLMVVWLSWNMS